MSRRPGVALIVVAGVLGLLASVSIAFLVLSRMERRASGHRRHFVKSTLLARSAVEDALARLGAGQDETLVSVRYGGEDLDADGLLSWPEAAQQVYVPALLNVDDCPVEHALRPSFFVRSGTQPAQRPLDGRERGYSGRLGGDESAGGNTYALRILPEGGIFVNGGDPASGPALGYNAVLRRILGLLAQAVGPPLALADGEALVLQRPAVGWRSLREIRDLALGGSQVKLDLLAPHLALEAWVDRKVIAPGPEPLAPLEGLEVHSWAEVIQAQGGPPGFETLSGKVVGRAPVSLSWARSRGPVLMALISGLRGLYLDESTATLGDMTDVMGTLRPVEISPAEASAVAGQILAWTGPLDRWEDWDALCESLPYWTVLTGTPEEAQAKRDLLKANFNPNSRLNKWNPNASLWRGVDKSALETYSTEFILEPVRGRRISGEGRVVSGDGKVLARRRVEARIAPPDAVRLSTQREFAASALGRPDLAGDEIGPRPLAQLSTPSLGGGVWTWGQRLGIGAQGASLQTHPEPWADAGSGPALHPADCDGSVQLATLETRPDDFHLVPAASPALKSLGIFDTGFGLDAGGGSLAHLPDLQQVTLAEMGHSVLDPVKPNTLYPDGGYSERGRCLQYLSLGNADGFHGVFSFWVKFHNALPASRGSRLLSWTHHVVPTAAVDTQYFYLGFSVGNDLHHPDKRFVGFFEIGRDPSDVDMMGASREHACETDVRTPDPHRWILVTARYDFRTPASSESFDILVDEGTGPGDLGVCDVYSFSGVNDYLLATDITAADGLGAHRMSLGSPALPAPYASDQARSKAVGQGADATFDEWAVYDFGGADGGGGGTPADTLASPPVFASSRFREGRYYKESAYPSQGGLLLAPGPARSAAEYLTAPLDLGTARILYLSWTEVRPRGIRSPPGVRPGIDGDNAPDPRILFEFVDAFGTGYLSDAAGVPMDAPFADAALSRIARTVAGPFRLHAVFQPNLEDPDNTPILDPLALDDVTLVYTLPGGLRLVGWD